MSTTMRRITQDAPGGPEVLHLEEAPVPEPIPTEIRVRVTAAGVNPVDTKVRAGGAGLGDDMTARRSPSAGTWPASSTPSAWA